MIFKCTYDKRTWDICSIPGGIQAGEEFQKCLGCACLQDRGERIRIHCFKALGYGKVMVNSTYLQEVHRASFKGGADGAARDEVWVFSGDLFSPGLYLPGGTTCISVRSPLRSPKPCLTRPRARHTVSHLLYFS